MRLRPLVMPVPLEQGREAPMGSGDVGVSLAGVPKGSNSSYTCRIGCLLGRLRSTGCTIRSLLQLRKAITQRLHPFEQRLNSRRRLADPAL